jgi:class 3 adenylate cyclase
MGDEAEIRLSDADRERVVELLRRHCSDGRLTLDEFAERAGVVYAARTRSDLAPALSDLPDPRGLARVSQPVAAPLPASGEPQKKRKWIVAIMSGARRKGRWRVDRPITAFAFWGGIDIDLRGAQIDVPVVEITAWAIMGGIDIVVPEGIPVDLDGFMLMGGRDDRVADVPPVPGAPVVRVTAYGMWGGVTVRSKKAGEKHVSDVIHEKVHERIQEREERRRERLDRRAERWAAHHTPPVPSAPPAPTASLPGPSLEGLIPTIPQPARETVRSVLRSVGLIDAIATGDPDQVPPPERPVPHGTVTILFTDISRSTELAERIGDQRWIGVLQSHNALVREQLTKHGGTEVKVHGDGFMVVFPSARAALLCAIGIQRAFEGYRTAHPDTPVEVRIGLHTGEVVEEGGDYFGRNVILAARIAGHAQGGEILASALVKELTDAAGDLGFDGGRDVELKGLSRPWRVHRVEWA